MQKHVVGLFVCGLLAFFGSALRGQAIPEDEMRIVSRPYTPSPTKLRVQANLVEVRVVVRDRDGHPVTGLRQGDFRVFDNGKPQVISHFSAEDDLTLAASATGPNPLASTDAAQPAAPVHRPRFAALFFDDRNMELADLVAARKAAQTYIDGGSLEPGDHVGLFTSSRSLMLEFTDDRKKLSDSLAQLRTRVKRPDEGPAACPPMAPYQAHLIKNVHDDQALDLAIAQGVAELCLYGLSRPDQALIVQRRADQVLSVTEQFAQDTLDSLERVVAHLGQMPGRRALVLVSAGFFSSSLQREQDRIVQAALRSEVIIDSLDAKGLSTGALTVELQRPTGRLRGDQMAYSEVLRSQQREAFDDVMASLSRDTGGTFFHNNNDLSRGLRDLLAVPTCRYLLAFSPRDLKPDGRFHNLKVSLSAPGRFTVDARRGYFAPDKHKPPQAAAAGALDAAVLGSGKIADFPAGATTHLERDDSEPVLRVTLHVDVRDLPFQHRSGRRIEKLRLVTALFDSEGSFLFATEAVIDLALKDATLAQLSKEGLSQKVSLRAPAGAYTLREVVQETVKGRISANSQPVEIR